MALFRVSTRIAVGYGETASFRHDSWLQPSFTAAIWKLVQSWDNDGIARRGQSFTSTSEWWDSLVVEKPQKDQRRIIGAFSIFFGTHGTNGIDGSSRYAGLPT
jgi:hypothetical protein